MDGIGERASFLRPAGIEFDPVKDVLYVADAGANKIKVIDIDCRCNSSLRIRISANFIFHFHVSF